MDGHGTLARAAGALFGTPLRLVRRLAMARWTLAVLLAAVAVGSLLLLGGDTLSAAWRGTSVWEAAGWALSGLLAFALASRLALWLGYRPLQPAAEDLAALPRLTVVIPAFNEGPMVLRSIESVLASDYPADRLDVIVVDDGSTDDTGAWIDRAAARHPARVRAIHLPDNRGKRHALFTGFRAATSDVVATVDSDSEVDAGSLAALVLPMQRDRRVAGVAGKVVALNRGSNLMTRMLGVRYILGFDFVRAYQSQLGTVWCCPGALQAYRREVIAPHLTAWRDQTFLGAACTNGDDHAMTNLVLSLGHRTVYQSNAVVRTIVPRTYRKLCRMYVRWGRSATREGLRAMRFAPRRAIALGPVRGPLMLLDALMQPLGIASRFVGLAAVAALIVTAPAALVHLLGATAVSAGLYALLFLRSELSLQAGYGILYAFFALVALPWVQPFATLTVRRNGWLTRG